VIHLDTHVVVWLVQGDTQSLRPAQARLEQNALAISPMVLFELQVLYEIRRLGVPAREAVDSLAEALGLALVDVPFLDVARHAQALSWTRDPFDRLIAATALACNAPLLTRDRTMLANLPLAVWE
jgi:PIN domain nuclease of toxin-antitoxin system